MKSKDGYIINQGLTQHIHNGRYDSAYNGCGWIAAYNFLKINGVSMRSEKVRTQLRLIMKGKFGTNPFSLYRFLRRNGFPVQRTYRLRKSKNYNSGIVLYFTGKTLHYVAFYKTSEDTYRFLNATYGLENDIRAFPQFIDESTKFPLGMILSI
ncbi:hypothetical protein G7062_09895 [Erysipelothrix sp. HDW6C]|uniref:hypothetical protein n=1 Tax=Erysipelothrix sp. HDW6C TaxID=2714930 RepID=UPI00140A18CE|nr:hypothetical protein [Erysipelothrix sp. HDW6C]QIK70595.1 hypothetical protein G7062_09895 [Erysipelothrix sp. HDW6C]